MRVKLFWKNDYGNLNELYEDGTLERPSFKIFKDSWTGWLSGKNQSLCGSAGGREELSRRRSQELEDEINVWLSQNPGINVVDLKQSASGGGMSPSQWIISVWYEEAS